jgi:putative hydrolase of the HAD superfamily
LALRAVVFDYGKVLSGPPEPEAHAAMLRITGLPLDRFERHYWAGRPLYDEGKITGIEYWRKFLREAGLDGQLGQAVVEELNQWDARMWTTQNPAMLAWQKLLKERGLLTAILSNIGDDVVASVEREFDWIHRFDVLVWSYQVHMVKPNPAIYRYTLKKLRTRPGETLFLDDRAVNIEAARAVGMKALEFSTIERLREDLIAAGVESALPLP